MDLRIIKSKRIALRNLKEQRQRVVDSVFSITSQLSGMPSSHQHKDKMAEYVAQNEELIERIAKAEAELEGIILEADLMLSQLPEQQYRVTRMWYIEDMKVRKIAKKLNYSVPYIYKIMNKAREHINDFNRAR